MTAGLFGIILSLLSASFLSINVQFLFTILFLISKDVYFENGSIGKKLLAIRLINSNNENNSVPFYSKIGRNLFLILYPIEFIVLLLNKGRRIGDLLFKTRVL